MGKGNGSGSGSGKAVATYNSGKAVSAYNSDGKFGTNQKQVTYWENKNTGQYVRETVTQKSNSSESRNYHTMTVGNKATGDHHTKQSQQVYKTNDNPNQYWLGY